jgi:hypothetical protein
MISGSQRETTGVPAFAGWDIALGPAPGAAAGQQVAEC